MHFLKHLTVWGLCAVMLGTQPSFASVAEVSAKAEDTYAKTGAQVPSGKEGSAKEETEEETVKDDHTDPTTEDTASTEESSSESSSEETDASSEETEESGKGDSSQNTEHTAPDEETDASSEQTQTTGTGSAADTSDAEKDSSTADRHTENTAKATESDSPTDKSDADSAGKKKDSSADDKADPSGTPEKNGKSSKRKKEDASENKTLKRLDDSVISEEESVEKDEEPEAVIPKIYGAAPIITGEDAEYMGDFVYYNQTDGIWNQNGYRIASAGCGPTSMAVVISSLTDQWVTPVDAAVWAYEHGYYSAAGSAHALIPAIAEAYGLKCKGVGADYASVRKALRKGRPVVALMGPGYFTRKGHFMVLIDIDDEDNVTVADVGSRSRSAYRYALSDIIRQSKSASAGGPFWVISKSGHRQKEKKTYISPQSDYVIHTTKNGQDTSITFHLGDRVSYHGTEGVIRRFENRKAHVTGADGQVVLSADGNDTIRLSDLRIIKHAPDTIYTAAVSGIEDSLHR